MNAAFCEPQRILRIFCGNRFVELSGIDWVLGNIYVSFLSPLIWSADWAIVAPYNLTQI